MFVKNITEDHSHYIRWNPAVWFDVDILKRFSETLRVEYFVLIVFEKAVSKYKFRCTALCFNVIRDDYAMVGHN